MHVHFMGRRDFQFSQVVTSGRPFVRAVVVKFEYILVVSYTVLRYSNLSSFARRVPGQNASHVWYSSRVKGLFTRHK